MGREESDDAAIALNDSLGVPGRIVGNDAADLMEVLGLRQDVGRKEQVDFPSGGS